jgi:hypothetical protein
VTLTDAQFVRDVRELLRILRIAQHGCLITERDFSVTCVLCDENADGIPDLRHAEPCALIEKLWMENFE